MKAAWAAPCDCLMTFLGYNYNMRLEILTYPNQLLKTKAAPVKAVTGEIKKSSTTCLRPCARPEA